MLESRPTAVLPAGKCPARAARRVIHPAPGLPPSGSVPCRPANLVIMDLAAAGCVVLWRGAMSQAGAATPTHCPTGAERLIAGTGCRLLGRANPAARVLVPEPAGPGDGRRETVLRAGVTAVPDGDELVPPVEAVAGAAVMLVPAVRASLPHCGPQHVTGLSPTAATVPDGMLGCVGTVVVTGAGALELNAVRSPGWGVTLTADELRATDGAMPAGPPTGWVVTPTVPAPATG